MINGAISREIDIMTPKPNACLTAPAKGRFLINEGLDFCFAKV